MPPKKDLSATTSGLVWSARHHEWLCIKGHAELVKKHVSARDKDEKVEFLVCSKNDCTSELRLTQAFLKKEVGPNPKMTAVLKRLRDEYSLEGGNGKNEEFPETLVAETDSEANDPSPNRQQVSRTATSNTRWKKTPSKTRRHSGRLSGRAAASVEPVVISDHESGQSDVFDLDLTEVESVFDTEVEEDQPTTVTKPNKHKRALVEENTSSYALDDEERPKQRLKTGSDELWKVPKGCKNTGRTILEVWMNDPLQVYNYRNMYRKGKLRSNGSWKDFEKACVKAGITSEFLDALHESNRPISDEELQRLRALKPRTKRSGPTSLTPLNSKDKTPMEAKARKISLIGSSSEEPREDATPSSYHRTARHLIGKKMKTSFEKCLDLDRTSYTADNDTIQYINKCMTIAFEVVAWQLARVDQDVLDSRMQSG
ncbi:hypothetical protein P171DRAFT_441320 [Karstenula rhodostoma CBS 690.94]|uniref:Uncharacterized protein n=1 Tax=Karstenula rhodostoma CBS 690.94 TaxID=1392251 RepID=A0A9P4PTG7_9PLEO|nr:hypothetical protein P171DRAFT_441320 [Karstenula rhodostoma CBS 690.94]